MFARTRGGESTPGYARTHIREAMTKTERSIRIVIADDHTIFREGLKTLLSRHPEFKVVGEAGDGDEACKLVEKLKPDILLLDFLMPKVCGIDVLRSLAESHSKVRRFC